MIKVAIAVLLFKMPVSAPAADSDVSALRSQLEEQRALIREQSELLKLQQQKIDRQAGRD
ncbi:MAG: hypothetical protein JSU90_05570 [Nitrospiraceae bacterium]|nr:MAG: hypothetical protein JSU90_05570 [Nitrospiraceae bacterium]